MKFKKKPVEIEARHWATEDDAYDLADWCGGTYSSTTSGPAGPNGEDWGLLTIDTLEGEMTAAPGDWIIRGIKGEYYPCKPDIFEQTYDPADADNPPRSNHITLTAPTGTSPAQLLIDGDNHSMSVFSEGIEIVTVGADTQHAEAGLRLTFSIGQLDLGDQVDVPITTANIAELNNTIKGMTALPDWCQCGSPSATALTKGDHLRHDPDGCRIIRTDQTGDAR